MAKRKGSKSVGRVANADASGLSPLPRQEYWRQKREEQRLKNEAFRDARTRANYERAKQLYSDRRRFNPTKTISPPYSTLPLAHRLVDKAITVRQRRRRFHARISYFTDPTYTVRTYVRSRIGFSLPRRVEVCIRRQIRKEVLFARRKTGAGKPKQKRPVRNIWSAISCRR
ncbi:MAG: hypothetical protein QXT77_07490 [Candidatus Methanomethylicaceae archaeon]